MNKRTKNKIKRMLEHITSTDKLPPIKLQAEDVSKKKKTRVSAFDMPAEQSHKLKLIQSCIEKLKAEESILNSEGNLPQNYNSEINKKYEELFRITGVDIKNKNELKCVTSNKILSKDKHKMKEEITSGLFTSRSNNISPKLSKNIRENSK